MRLDLLPAVHILDLALMVDSLMVLVLVTPLAQLVQSAETLLLGLPKFVALLVVAYPY